MGGRGEEGREGRREGGRDGTGKHDEGEFPGREEKEDGGEDDLMRWEGGG